MTRVWILKQKHPLLAAALAIALVLTLVLGSSVSADDPAYSLYPPPPYGAPYEGDANGDGNVNIIDAMFIAQYTVGLRQLEGDCLLAADSSSDGLVNIVDAMHIAQYTVDPNGTAEVLFKPLWEWPADGGTKDPRTPSQNGG